MDERFPLLLNAIATEEGYFQPHSRARRNNNPGDLIYCDESIHFGASHSDGHFAVFPDDATGFDALRKWLSVTAHFDKGGNLVGGYLGATIRQAVYRFAPPIENNSVQYLLNVCKFALVEPDTILTAELLR